MNIPSYAKASPLKDLAAPTQPIEHKPPLKSPAVGSFLWRKVSLLTATFSAIAHTITHLFSNVQKEPLLGEQTPPTYQAAPLPPKEPPSQGEKQTASKVSFDSVQAEFDAYSKHLDEIKKKVEAVVKKIDSHTKIYLSPERKYDPTPSVDFYTTEGSSLLNSVCDSMLQEQNLLASLLIFLVVKNLKPTHKNASFADIVKKNLCIGTCFGQAMNIVETLSVYGQTNCSEHFISTHFDPKKIIRYQLIHHVLKFFRKRTSLNPQDRISLQPCISQLESAFPLAKTKKLSSEKMELEKLSQSDLAGRIADFIKVQSKTSDDPTIKKDCVVLAILGGKKHGHVVTTYYSETYNKYYWYDSSSSFGGLFSANDFKTFLQEISQLLFQYGSEGEFDHLMLTAYDLNFFSTKL